MPPRSTRRLALGRAVRAARERQGLTQEEVAGISGLAPTYLSDVERGIRNPTYDSLCQLAAALKTPLAEIIGEAEGGR